MKEAARTVETTYERLRASVIREYAFFAGQDCSGLSHIKTSDSEKRPMSPAEAIFAIDVRTCMEGMLETRIIEKELCPLDYSFFMTQIQELSDRLRETQRKAMVGYYAVPERAQANPELIPQLQNPISQVFEFEERQIEIEERFFADMNRAMAKGRKMEPKVSFEEQRSNVKKRRLKYAVAAEQHRIALAYGQDIRKEVFNLTQLKWPSNEIGVH